jgi:type IV pilus assembly protein PilQ
MVISRTGRRIAGAALLASLALLANPVFTPDAAAQDAVVSDIDVISEEVSPTGEAKVFIDIDGTIGSANVSAFKAEDPLRWVIDLADVNLGSIDRSFEGVGELIKSVEVATVDEGSGPVSRVTVYLHRPAFQEVDVARNRVTILLTPSTTGGDPLQAAMGTGNKSHLENQDNRGRRANAVSGPTDANAQGLTSLDFENLDDISRIVIGTAGNPNYSSSQPDPKMIVVDFPGLSVPQSLTRVLDTSEFISPVRMVRAYRTASGARVAINLRSSASWNIRPGEDGLLYVDIDVSDTMRKDRAVASQGFSAVAPSQPGNTSNTGLHGAYTSETLIGETGRTVNPQLAFGTGGGMGDPSSLMLGSAGWAFDNNSAVSGGWSGRRINIDLVEADIHSVFRLISHVSRLNIVAGDDVAGSVTVRLENVPWDQALAAILQAKGLAAQRFGNIIRVAPIETIKAEQQAALEAKNAKDALEPLSLLVVPLNYSTADEVVNQLQQLVSSRGQVEADGRTNQLIIQDTEDRLAKMRELLRQIDRQTPQVLIEARVVEASSRFTRSLGVQWGGELDASAATGYSTGAFFPSSVGAGGAFTFQSGGQAQPTFYSPGIDNLAVDLAADGASSGVAFNLGSIPGLVDIDARLTAMESDGWGEIISSPRVTTLDNTPAKISQGARIPYLSTSAGGTQVQFVEAALELEVTPHITSDGRIFMAIAITNNRPDFGNTVQGQPALLIKEAETELLIDNGDTTVIGGVFATETSESWNRVPFLGRIPILGSLFRNHTKNESRDEMLVFVTPRIVNESSGQ